MRALSLRAYRSWALQGPADYPIEQFLGGWVRLYAGLVCPPGYCRYRSTKRSRIISNRIREGLFLGEGIP